MEENYTLNVEKIIPEVVIPERTETITYDRGFIENQIIDITAQRDSMIAEKEALIILKESELAECSAILLKMDEAGIIAKPIETRV